MPDRLRRPIGPSHGRKDSCEIPPALAYCNRQVTRNLLPELKSDPSIEGCLERAGEAAEAVLERLVRDGEADADVVGA